MNFVAGQTYLYPLTDFHTAHLWVITTNPNSEGLVLVVSLTSLNGSKDQTVILNGGEHPFLKWATVVAYGLAELVKCDAIEAEIKMGRAKMHANMSVEKTSVILDGFTASHFTKKRIVRYVREYKASATSPTT